MARVFVGNLPDDVRERDLSDKFERFGRITSVKIKFPQRPPPFAFISYDDEQDASDAVRSMNNAMFSGSRLRVEISRGIDDARPRGTQFRVKLTGLPVGMSWQDLKDFLRDGGDVVHSDVDRRGNGSASFATQDEMRRAIRKLDGADLDGDRVRIREDVGGRSRSPSRSRSRSPPRRSRSRSPPRRRRSPSRSRSRSRSPRRYSNNRGSRRSRSRSR